MKLRCMHTARSRPFPSFSLVRPPLFFSLVHFTLLPLSEPLLSSLPLNRSWMRSPLPTPLRPPSFSFPTVFLPLLRPKRSNPTPPRLLLPALSHLLHCHPFPTFCSLTNRAAREYIFYRHSWWPPHICANLPVGLPLARLGQARPLRTRAIPDLPRLTLRCLSLTLLGYNPTPFRCIVGITNLFSFYIILLFYDSIEASN